MNMPQHSIYHSDITWDRQVGGGIHIRNAPPISVSMPVQHGGDGVNPCPIELLVSALGSCFLGTFLVFQRQLLLSLRDIKVNALGNVELIDEGKDRGKYDIKSVDLSIDVTVVGDSFDEEIVQDCIRLTEEHCPVSRLLRKAVPVIVQRKIKILYEQDEVNVKL